MQPIVFEFDYNSKSPLYIQLYSYIKDKILCGEIIAGEKLPSLRKLSKDLGISITTTELSYNQLVVEGYITSRPQAGYFVSDITSVDSNLKAEDIPILYDIKDYTL